MIHLIISIILKWYEPILRYLDHLQYNMKIFMISIGYIVTSTIDFFFLLIHNLNHAKFQSDVSKI